MERAWTRQARQNAPHISTKQTLTHNLPPEWKHEDFERNFEFSAESGAHLLIFAIPRSTPCMTNSNGKKSVTKLYAMGARKRTGTQHYNIHIYHYFCHLTIYRTMQDTNLKNINNIVLTPSSCMKMKYPNLINADIIETKRLRNIKNVLHTT